MIQDISLLLFSVNALSFGVYAGQVEELLDARTFPESKDISSGSLISYKGQDIWVINFSRRLRLEQHQETMIPARPREEDFAPGSSPKILIIKCRNGSYSGICVKHLEKLLTISMNQVYSLPLIMQKKKEIQAIWGIALIENRPVILIDPEQL